jgi:hypothetical protein
MICLKEKTFNQLLNLAINNCNKNNKTNKTNKINKPIYRPINLIRTNLTNSNFPTLTPTLTPTSTPQNWNQDNITELDNNLRKFFTQFSGTSKIDINPTTYNNIQKAVIRQYTFDDYHKYFFDFASQDYLGSSNIKINTDIIPTDDNIKLALFILQNLNSYQQLDRKDFQNIFSPYIYFIYQDKTRDATGYIYDYLRNIKVFTPPTIVIFLTALRINLNLIIHSNPGKYNSKGIYTIEDMSPLFTEFGDYLWNPAIDYCNNKLNL